MKKRWDGISSVAERWDRTSSVAERWDGISSIAERWDKISQAVRQQAEGMSMSNLEPSHVWDLDLLFMIGTQGSQNVLTSNIGLGTFPTNRRILDRTIRTEHQETSGRQKGTIAMAFPLSAVPWRRPRRDPTVDSVTCKILEEFAGWEHLGREKFRCPKLKNFGNSSQQASPYCEGTMSLPEAKGATGFLHDL